MTAECDCGFEAKNEQGLAVHQRSCDEVDEAEESSESYETPTTVPNAVADAVFHRDDEQCVRCGDESGLTIHRYDDEGEDIPQNLVTLCAECDDLLGDGDPLTKRTQVGR